MVVGTGLGIGMDGDRAGPEFLGAHTGKVDRRLAVHARRLGGVAVELTGADDAHAVVLPQGFVAVVV